MWFSTVGEHVRVEGVRADVYSCDYPFSNETYYVLYVVSFVARLTVDMSDFNKIELDIPFFLEFEFWSDFYQLIKI